MSPPETKERRRKKRGPTRNYFTNFNEYSGAMAVCIGDDPDVESTVIVWYRNILALYDGDDYRYGLPHPLKISFVEDAPKIYFDSLCRIPEFDDQDDIRDYITDSRQDPKLIHTIESQQRQLKMELPQLDGYISQIVSYLREEVEDYMSCSGTPWRRFKTWLRRVMQPNDYLPKHKKPTTKK